MGEIRLWPLGGLGEIGMNCLAVEQEGQVLLIDCGVTFDDLGRGVDVIHPDFSSLEPYQGRVVGVVVTHGHEDHIGALPYLLRRFDVPIWAPPYASELLKERTGEHEVLRYAAVERVRGREPFRAGPFGVELVEVTHSTPDAFAVALRTSAGLVIHTGDFKFDEGPIDGRLSDVARLSELGDEGVDLLLSDSTNVDSEGATFSESGVGDALEELVRQASGAVVVSLFASNAHRLERLGRTAERTGRKLLLLGRGVRLHSRVGRDTGHISWPSDLVYSPDFARDLPRNRVLAIATGSQAEQRAALTRLARDEHPDMKLARGDTVIFSSRIIPGKEPEVYGLMATLLRLGVIVRSRATDRGIHASGHAHRQEQRHMIELTRPKSFVPLHGTLHHLLRHADLAVEAGAKCVRVIENGDVVALRSGGVLRPDGRVPVGRVHVFEGRVVEPNVLNERGALRTQGVVSVGLTVVDRRIERVSIESVGVLNASDAASRTAQMEAAILGSVTLPNASGADGALQDEVRRVVRRYCFRSVGTKPQVLVHVVRA